MGVVLLTACIKAHISPAAHALSLTPLTQAQRRPGTSNMTCLWHGSRTRAHQTEQPPPTTIHRRCPSTTSGSTACGAGCGSSSPSPPGSTPPCCLGARRTTTTSSSWSPTWVLGWFLVVLTSPIQERRRTQLDYQKIPCLCRSRAAAGLILVLMHAPVLTACCCCCAALLAVLAHMVFAHPLHPPPHSWWATC